MVLIEDSVLRAAKLTEREVKIELAVALYAKGKLSYAQALQLSGLGRIAFAELLFDAGVPSEFTVEEFQKDLQTLQFHLKIG